MNKQLQINQTEQLITQARTQLKTWANQISHHHKQLKALSQELETIKQQITMKNNLKQNENNNNKLNTNQGGTK